MVDKNELLRYPNYLLSSYQLEIYRQLASYMEENKLKKKDIARKLNVSSAYISQVLKGEFNFTLKKLVELGLAMDKVPYLEFISPEEYWRRDKEGTVNYVNCSHTFHVQVESSVKGNVRFNDRELIDYKGGKLPESVSKKGTIIKNNLHGCRNI